MGRQIRRVKMTFSWPLNKVWDGFLQGEVEGREQCPSCEGSGYSAEAQRLHEEWYGLNWPSVRFDPKSTGSEPFPAEHPRIAALARRNAEGGMVSEAFEARRLAEHFNRSWSHHLSRDDVDALVEAGRLMDFTNRPRTPEQQAELAAQAAAGGSGYWMKGGNGYRPTAAEVNEWSLGGFGHDSINAWVCVKAKCEREGASATCSACNGEGEIWESPEARARAEAWTPVEPPTGAGWQLWETVSEGSPISPVFRRREDLARWLADNDRDGLSYRAWLRWLRVGWAPSFIGSVRGLRSGVAALAERRSAQDPKPERVAEYLAHHERLPGSSRTRRLRKKRAVVVSAWASRRAA